MEKSLVTFASGSDMTNGEDVVQKVLLRAFLALDNLRSDDAKPLTHHEEVSYSLGLDV
jgi:DNA-directed RNA polymerase specialized sigma24 family protein